MSVYKEGFYAKDLIEKRSVRIFNDACDFGAPTSKGDEIWNMASTINHFYGDENTRKEERYLTGKSCSVEFTLIDEWAVSDERKTVNQATETFILSFTSCTTGNCKGFEGYITICKK